MIENLGLEVRVLSNLIYNRLNQTKMETKSFGAKRGKGNLSERY